MSLKSQYKAASALMLATPPHRSGVALKSIVRVRGGDSADEPAFISKLLELANQPHSGVQCANTACGKTFLSTEFNRDGDAYRCPFCNQFTSSNGTCFPRRSNPVTKQLRRLERRLIQRFTEYTKLYYPAETALVNCFVWSNGGSTVDDLGVVVLIVSCSPSPSSDDGAGDAPSHGVKNCVWNSTHNFRITYKDERYAFQHQCTFYVDLGVGPCRFSGFIERRPPISFDRSQDDLLALAVGVGLRVQQVENKVRDEVASLHFAKAAQVTTALRPPSRPPAAFAEQEEPLRTATIAATAGRPMPPPPSMPSTATLAGGSGRPSVTSAPPPPPPPQASVEPVRDPPAKEVEDREDWGEGEAEEDGAKEAEPEQAEEWTLEDVLSSLEVEDVPGLLERLAAAEVTSVEELLQCDEAWLKHQAGIARAPRKAIFEWISWQFDQGDGEEQADE